MAKTPKGASLRSSAFVDDNFGHYVIESEEDIEYYFDVQRNSVLKKCQGCGRKVKLLPHYAYCDSCTTKIEQGFDLG